MSVMQSCQSVSVLARTNYAAGTFTSMGTNFGVDLRERCGLGRGAL